MTVYSKANLMVAKVASKDEFDRGMHGLRLEADGSTVGRSKRGMMIVSPADPNKAHVPPKVGDQVTPGDEGMIIELDHVDKVVKNMSKDRRPELGYVTMTKCTDPRMAEFTCCGIRDMHRVSQLPKADKRYPDWRAAVRKVLPSWEVEEGDGVARVVVSRKELIGMLQALDGACPAQGGYDPVWMEFSSEGGGIVLRSQNTMTGQVAIGIAVPFGQGVGWLEWGRWEWRIWEGVKKVARKIIRRGKK